MIIAQLSIAPVGEGLNLGKYVKTVINILQQEQVKFEVNAMATVLEVKDISSLFNIVQKAHTAVLEKGAKRVITELKIDDRKDKAATIETKLKELR
jgi:uncharacterized protein (TIGR00106 family)